MPVAYQAVQILADLLFPSECLGCGTEGTWLCTACRNVVPATELQCPGCNQPTLWGECCPQCRSAWALTGIIAVADYRDETLARAIQACKYRFSYQIAAELGDFFASRLVQAAAEPAATPIAWWHRPRTLGSHPAFAAALVMPIPLAPRRLRWRGFNQAATLAYRAAERFDLTLDTASLRRQRYRRPQAGLAAVRRWENVADSFVWQGGPLNGRTVILIDDVVTTGATFEAAAQVLRAAGAGSIWGVALARG